MYDLCVFKAENRFYFCGNQILPAFFGSTHKAVLSSPRFFFFDCGVRNAAAGLSFSVDTLKADPGPLFEQWVGIKLYKRLSFMGEGHLSCFRALGGAEVDFIVERAETLYPIEVKWTENPTKQDARHLENFIPEHADRTPQGYILCRCHSHLGSRHRFALVGSIDKTL